MRFRVDFGKRVSLGIGKVELLEGIARTGSLSRAARDMRMSYRRAWLLLEDLNSSFDKPVAHSTVGGRGGGGVVLTAFGVRLVAGYRSLESSMQPLAQSLSGRDPAAHQGRQPQAQHPRRVGQTKIISADARTRLRRSHASLEERCPFGAQQFPSLGVLEARRAFCVLRSRVRRAGLALRARRAPPAADRRPLARGPAPASRQTRRR